MNVRNLSTTLVSNWELCAKRAWRSYSRRLDFGDDNEGTNATRFGTVAHAVMEVIHQGLMCGDVVKEQVIDEYVLEVFDEEWKASKCYDFEYFQDGRAKVPDFIRRSIFNRLGTTIGTEILFVYDAVTEQVFLANSREECKAIVARILEEGGVPVVSEIDRLDRIDDHTFEVYDYKTNFLPFTRDEIENSKQLGLYDLVVRAMYPEATDVTCVYDMLRHGRFPVTFTDQFREDLRAYLCNLWAQIYADENPEERINKYCRWCEIRSNCSAYAAAMDSNIPPILTDKTDTPEGIAALYAESERLANLIKLAEERRTEVTTALKTKLITDSPDKPLRVGDTEYYLIQNPRYDFDKQGIFNSLQSRKALSLLPGIISVSKQSVDRMLKQRPEFKADFESLLTKRFVNPTLKARRLKGGSTTNTEEGVNNDA